MTRTDSARFRVRSGEFEIEYEGPSDLVESRYSEALTLLEEKPLSTKGQGGVAQKKELQNRKIPGVDKNNVGVALDRRVRARKLKSIKDNGEWVYWTD